MKGSGKMMRERMQAMRELWESYILDIFTVAIPQAIAEGKLDTAYYEYGLAEAYYTAVIRTYFVEGYPADDVPLRSLELQYLPDSVSEVEPEELRPGCFVHMPHWS